MNGDSYKFGGTFGFIRKVALKGRDPVYLYDDLTTGLLPPDHILNILSCSLEQVNGDDVTSNHDEIIEKFIEAAGLQESSFVARIMLSHAMIGSVKKKKIREKDQIQGMQLKTKNFLSRNSKRLGLSLVATSLILIVLACMNFSS